MISKLVFNWSTRVLATNILDYKLVSISLLETNLESKILVDKTLVKLMVRYQFKNYFINFD